MNKEIEEILQTLDGIASGDWIQMLPKEAKLLLSYIEQLEKENQQLKKQKADVVESIKKQITFCTNEAEGTVNNDKCWMAVNYLKKILRMLGEIDENIYL